MLLSQLFQSTQDDVLFGKRKTMGVGDAQLRQYATLLLSPHDRLK
jgi:hypothetical protein